MGIMGEMTVAATKAMKKKRINTVIICYAALAVLWLITSLSIKGFATINRTVNTLQTASFLGIVATAQTIVVVTGGIDLSVSGVITFASVVIAALLKTDIHPLLCAAIAILAGACIGAFNAFSINFLKMPPLIMSIATLSIIEGSLLIATNGTPPNGKSDLIVWLAKGKPLLGVPNSVWIWALVCLCVYWLLHRSRYGRHFFGMGTNMRVCLLSGVKTKKLTFMAYMLSSSLASLAGTLLFGYIGNTYLTLGRPYQLDSIAAVVLGGTSILGGSGNFLGTIAGTLILIILKDTLNVLNIAQSGRNILLGVIIVLLLLVYGRERSTR